MAKGYTKEDKERKKRRKGKITPAKAEFWEDVDRDADKMVGKKPGSKRSLAC